MIWDILLLWKTKKFELQNVFLSFHDFKDSFLYQESYKSFKFLSEKNYLRTKEIVPQENKAGAGSFAFWVFLMWKQKSDLMKWGSPPGASARPVASGAVAWAGACPLKRLRDWSRGWRRKDLGSLDMCSGLIWRGWEYSHRPSFTQASLSLRWITWIRMGSVLWSMLHSEVIWRLSSFWFSVTGQWLASSKGCLRRATPSSRPSLLQPAWVTLR